MKNKKRESVVREYVDLCFDDQEAKEQLQQLVVAVILKLKQLYFNRKTKIPKGKPFRGNASQSVNKRYLVGLHEVMKNLKIGEIKMILLATDLEKVDYERGTDEVICNLIQTSLSLIHI